MLLRLFMKVSGWDGWIMSQTNDNIDSVSLETLRRQHSPNFVHDFFFFRWMGFQLCVLSFFSFFFLRDCFSLVALSNPVHKQTPKQAKERVELFVPFAFCLQKVLVLPQTQKLNESTRHQICKSSCRPNGSIASGLGWLVFHVFYIDISKSIALECYLFLSQTLCLTWLVGPHNMQKTV